MRISDWSSDVCSSDLHRTIGKTDHGEGRGVRVGPDRRKNRETRRLARRHARPPARADPRRRTGGDRNGQVAQAVEPARRPGVGTERKSVVTGKSVEVRVDLGGRRILKKNTTYI